MQEQISKNMEIMTQKFIEEADNKARELVKYIRTKDKNEYDYNHIMEFARWYNGKVNNSIYVRESCIRLAQKISPSGTESKAIVEQAEEYFKFINQ
jgi:hypothetical protein